MKKISSGVMIYRFDGTTPYILLGHVTNFKNWDIFKGGVEYKEEKRELYESFLETAERELEEESGLKLESSRFKWAYHYPSYIKKKKELYVFPIEVEKHEIDIEKLVCTTYVPNTQTPEFDKFDWFEYDKALTVVGNGLKIVIEDLFEQHIPKR